MPAATAPHGATPKYQSDSAFKILLLKNIILYVKKNCL